MKSHIFSAVRLTLVLLALCCIVYPAFIWGIAYFTPSHGHGDTVEVNGKVVGYALIGQSFTADRYFNGRPSAVGYNAAGSGGSNKGPTNQEYLASVRAATDTFLIRNPAIKRTDVPVELVTASGSGLDPDISPQAAYVQMPRIARVRGISEDKLKALIAQNIQGRLLGVFGPVRVNVLQLNIALDHTK
ncbi:MAG: K(+)-transporting ATPase subunit C [Bacteroidetes bacterium]|nr:K(+)-transporting ATPase subunit C [Bacteroidota bacterium]